MEKVKKMNLVRAQDYESEFTVHQIWWQGEDKIPSKYHKNRESVKKFHPKWKYILWDQPKIEELIQTKYQWFWPTFQKYPKMIQKIDAAKPFLLKSAPGVYIDMDIEFVRSPFPLYNKYDIIFSLGNFWAVLSFFIFSFKEINVNNGFLFVRYSDSPFLQILAKKMARVMESPPKYSLPSLQIFATTGPEVFTWAVRHHLKRNPPLRVSVNKPIETHTPKFNERVGIFNQRIFECRTKAESLPSTVAFHRYEATWSPIVNRFYNFYTESTPAQRALWVTSAVLGILSFILLLVVFFLLIIRAVRVAKLKKLQKN